jgi:hypothetical protein
MSGTVGRRVWALAVGSATARPPGAVAKPANAALFLMNRLLLDFFVLRSFSSSSSGLPIL